jgi:hypothetical protein
LRDHCEERAYPEFTFVTKAVSWQGFALPWSFHRVAARAVEDHISGHPAVNHFPVKLFRQPSLWPIASAAILTE